MVRGHLTRSSQAFSRLRSILPAPDCPDTVRTLDLNRLPPEERVRFARERNALRDKAVAQRTLEESYVKRYTEALRRRSGS